MDSPLGKLLTKSQIAFKAYYFIGGDRTIYYGITRSELGVISDYLEKNGGIKLYRNGFRVPKYGDQENDWLSIEKNSRIGKGIPFSNKNLVGFVQLTDPKGEVFEESAGREGLIEKEAFTQLQQFISKALQDAFLRFISWFRKSDEYKASNPDKKPAPTASSVKKNVANLKDAAETLRNPDATEEQKAEASIKLEVATKIFISASNAAISELEMMRVLAGTGLTIAEFIHEVKQIVPSTKNYIEDTLAKKPDTEISENLRNIKSILSSLEAYTSYFDETISKNVLRDLQPIDLRIAVKSFMEVTAWDFRRRKIDIQLGLTGKDLISTPMHPSEWNTILQNLYSNAKKAIIKAGVGRGRILISARKDISSGNIIFEFQDNGSGIKEKDKSRIFDAFFTTATNRNDELGTGTGLGLHILQQMIVNRGGAITVELPEAGFKTNIRITLPLANTTELKKYGY
ncbi:HAMP domain-containing sensor histidine kinase [Dyadobacter sp. 676]|uniref:histidine kinase n=1 Tax=Dyadobacter sp. 676 TaxID=3088362 RepID=A0AAU8FHJ0_9BACT